MGAIREIKGRKIVDSRENLMVEEKLLDLLGDPDQGFVLKKTIKDRLLRQRKAVASGQRGESLAVIVKRWGSAEESIT
jgi:hypothetical protein